jgi:hypothetical protein
MNGDLDWFLGEVTVIQRVSNMDPFTSTSMTAPEHGAKQYLAILPSASMITYMIVDAGL